MVRDSDIRVVLRERLERLHATQADTLILDELGLACSTARVDVAVVNSELVGYEIKSDADSLARLAGQVRTYDSVLDRAYLVAGTRHFDKAAEHVPERWGLMRAERVDGVVCVQLVRPAGWNSDVDPRALAMMLWRDELVTLLKAAGAYRGLSTRPKGALWDRLVEVMNVVELRATVRACIKARGDWRAAAASR